MFGFFAHTLCEHGACGVAFVVGKYARTMQKYSANNAHEFRRKKEKYTAYFLISNSFFAVLSC